MKLYTTKKHIKENSYRILAVGYCEAQYLLKHEEPFSYCAGYYGWSCDNYDLHQYGYNIIISTGYSPITDQNINKKIINNKYEIIKKYEDRACAICCKSQSWDKTKKQLSSNLKRFIAEVCKNED